jgi:hypothetical protein
MTGYLIVDAKGITKRKKTDKHKNVEQNLNREMEKICIA